MEIPKGSITEHIFESKELGEAIQLLIYLPATFSPLYKYSVLIAQDGQDYFRLGRIGQFADELLFQKRIENLIIVGVAYRDVKDRWRKYHPEGEQNRQYIRFLAHELVPYLDNVFPTYQVGSTRALIGASFGATVSLMTTLTYPHTFGKVILHSPFINDQVLNLIENSTGNQLVEIYHVIGTQETEVTTTDGRESDFLGQNRLLSKMMTEKRFNYFYEEFQGNHTWTSWQPDVRRALKMLF